MKENKGMSLLGLIVTIYLIISQGFMLYYWYEWSQTHNFWKTILVGPIIAELKGLVWIFLIW